MKTLLLAAAALLALPAAAEASRLYPTAGFVLRYEIDASREPRTLVLGQGAVALSLGRIAVRPTVRANGSRGELELSVLYRIGGP